MRSVPVTLALLLLLGLITTAPAAGAADAGLTLEAPATFAMHGNPRLVARLSAPGAGRTVRLQQQGLLGWSDVAESSTDASGAAALTPRFEETTTYRAVFAGDDDLGPATSTSVTVAGVPRPTRVTVAGTWTVVDGTSRTLAARFTSNLGEAVPGADLRVYTRLVGGSWRMAARAETDETGLARVTLAPRNDVRVQVNGPSGVWWTAASSAPRILDNLPPVTPVAYPRAAPDPRYVAPQPRAAGNSARAEVVRIPEGVWTSMRGRSWHPGCPVGRSELRLIRVNYWDFTGYQRRGELVVRDDVAARAAAALSAMYRAHLPIRSMYRVDRFGWNPRLQGADDLASMAADNTSAFNCRSVTNWPGRRSPHSYGRAIDINPFENPFVSRTGVVPNRWWLHRSHPRIAWRSSSHPVVRIWRAHGFHWSYPGSDPQHWDGRQVLGTAYADELAGTFIG